MINKIIVLLLGLPIGYVFIKYAQKIIDDFTGLWGWAENIIGSGGSYTACKLFGILICLLSIMYATGSLDVMISSLVKALGIF